ncbi:Gfo/Idh/MocA family protein [Paenibacillus sp. CMAA1364]
MRIGIAGYGLRLQHLHTMLATMPLDCQVVAIADPRCDQIKMEMTIGSESITFFDNVDDMLEKMPLDGVMIGTRCDLHTEMALKVLKKNLPLFLEKPVATNYHDLLRLKAGYEASQSQVIVSFPLRQTALVTLAKEIIDSGRIGTVEHVQAVNNVPYGGVYYHSWYRDEQITGGLFLQKATHDFDYINYLIQDNNPISVCAMKSKQIFKGDKPALLKCKECDEKYTCAESTIDNEDNGEYCCFAVDTGNEDSGSALIRYESGMHVSYSQNFFARRGAEKRGARFLGYKGTLEFDLYTSKLSVHMHHEARVETYQLDTNTEGHMGGDAKLLQNFDDIMRGGPSHYPLEDGLMSALLCIKANESANTNKFCDITWNNE